MIEVQIKSKELYNELKQYASYCSDLTLVCSFRDELSDLLKEYGVAFEEIKKEKTTPTLTITGRNIMKLENAPAEMLYFVGVRSEYDPTIPIRCMNEVRLLIKNGLVNRTERFNKLYSKIGYRSKIHDLISANVKFYGKGKLTDYIDPDATIQSLKFNDCVEKPIIYKQMKIKILTPLEKKDKWDEFTGKNQSGNRVVLRFYNRSIILKSIAFKGNEISIATTKVLVQSNDDHVVYDPIILPEGLNLIKDIMYSPKSRAIPIDLYRNALYEFLYRYEAEY